MDSEPRRPGRSKKLSHLDCGRTQCGICNQETGRPDIELEIDEYMQEAQS